MSQLTLTEPVVSQIDTEFPATTPPIDYIITEDDEPVDNLFSEKQQRLLTRALYSSTSQLTITQPFLVAANVGIFYGVRQPPIVPDVFLSLGVEVAEDWYAKEHRSYFVWEFGKVPEVVIEIVSNRTGGEIDTKKQRYARMTIPCYVVYDPQHLLGESSLQAFELVRQSYQPLNSAWFPHVGLGLRLWEGTFEGKYDQWLRWYDDAGVIVPTGEEQATQAHRAKDEAEQQVVYARQAKALAEQQANQAEQRAIQAEEQAAHDRQAKEKAEQELARTLAKLESLGVSLDEEEAG